jgi:hypothetical protein
VVWLRCVLLGCLWLAGCGRLGVDLLDLPQSQRDPANEAGLSPEDAGQAEASALDAAEADAAPVNVGDAEPAGPVDAPAEAEASTCGSDTDRDLDGVCAASDNCPTLPNPAQSDSDGNGVGDACQDQDGDGVVDASDPCPRDNPDDSDGDGVCNSVDKCARGDDRIDSDGDGVPNLCDTCPATGSGDTDGDGVCDDADACPGFDDRVDSDADRTPNGCDGCPDDAAKTAPGVCGCGVTAPAGLAGYWSFNASSGSVAADSSGAAHPGTLTNMAGTEWVAGRVGNALSFDGVDDYVNVGAVASGVRALSFWIKADSFGITTDQTGWLSPSATGAPNNQWTNPTRAYAKDGSSATTSTLIGSRAQDWSSFGIAMPSTTTGIEAKLDLPGGAGLLTNTQLDFSWNAGASYSSACSDAALLNLGSDTFVCGSGLWAHSAWTQAELSNPNFRVRVRYGGLLSSISLDLLQVNVHYASYTQPRNILQLDASTQLEFAGQSLRLIGFPAGSVVYVDRAVASGVDGAYHHVAIVSPAPINVSALQIGTVASDPLPFDGSLDELKLFTQPLSPADLNTLSTNPSCL